MQPPSASKTLATMAWGLCLLAVPLASSATDNFTATTGTEKSAKPRKPKHTKAPKPPSDKGSGENKAERDKRLQRECQGRPNAGACEGYGR